MLAVVEVNDYSSSVSGERPEEVERIHQVIDETVLADARARFGM